MFEADYFEFGKKWLNINADMVHGGKILEVSFLDTFRPIVTKMSPSMYVNASSKNGPGVDIEESPYNLVETFGKTYFDIVICDVLQYIKDWKRAVWALSSILNVHGFLMLGTRSIHHEKEHPSDHWRFTTNILYEAFRGFSIQELKDCDNNGVLFAATKRELCMNDTSSILAHEVE
jgi:hypothetical protein